MSIPAAWPQVLDFFGTPLVIEPSSGQLASDAGPLSRFENAIAIPSLKRLRDVFLDQFIASFDAPPRRLTFDLDAIDDPAHGHQQLTFWHGHNDQNQYLPLVITGADNDQIVMLSLRPGNVHAALGADDDLAYPVTLLRQVWPDVLLHLRGDCGFGVPGVYEVCERFRVSYTFSLSTNAVLQRETEGLLADAVSAYERERQAARQQDPTRPAVPSRLFTGFWYRAGTWPCARYVVGRADANDRGTNRRFVVTNRPGAVVLPGPIYDAYAARGESQNRNKEFKCDLVMDRLSDHRFVANYFRRYLHAAAMNLLVRLRRFIVEPLPALALQAQASPTIQTSEVVPPAGETVVPAEALTGAARQRHFRLRRQPDPLGEGHPCTWRTLLIKVAADIIVRTRRIMVLLSSSWPHLTWYRRVCERLRAPFPPSVPQPSG
jgi:hypothetical protein